MQANNRTVAGRLEGSRGNKREAAVLNELAKQIQTFTWDYSVDGGAVGTIVSGALLPTGAVVTAVYADELTAVTGADAITIKAGSTTLTASKDFTGGSGIGSVALASSATAIKLSAPSELSMVIATNPATAGKVRWAVEFYVAV